MTGRQSVLLPNSTNSTCTLYKRRTLHVQSRFEIRIEKKKTADKQAVRPHLVGYEALLARTPISASERERVEMAKKTKTNISTANSSAVLFAKTCKTWLLNSQELAKHLLPLHIAALLSLHEARSQ